MQLFVTSWGTVFDFYTQTKSLHFFKTAILKVANSAESRLLAQKLFYSRFITLKPMSDYTLEKRQEVVNVLTSRVIENAPLREIIRVYSEAVQAAIVNLDDAAVVRSISAAGYTDILEAFNIEELPAEETPVSETEVA